MKSFKPISFKEAKRKAAHYCAYQERSIQEVKEKLRSFDLPKEEAERILEQLQDENFIDEERFAQSFSQGKFNSNKWGKIKIRQALQQKGVPESIIQTGLAEIDATSYQDMIRQLIIKKENSLKDEDEYIKKNKIARYAIGKGFEPDLVWQILGNLNFGSN